MKKLIVLSTVLCAFLAGCATPPPGRLTEKDVITRKITVSGNVQQVMGNLHEGCRYCGVSTGNILFVTHHGNPRATPIRENGTASCDMYIPVQEGYKGQEMLLGVIEFKPIDKKNTEVTLKLVKKFGNFGNKDKIMNAWELFVQGRHKEVCPA